MQFTYWSPGKHFAVHLPATKETFFQFTYSPLGKLFAVHPLATRENFAVNLLALGNMSPTPHMRDHFVVHTPATRKIFCSSLTRHQMNICSSSRHHRKHFVVHILAIRKSFHLIATRGNIFAFHLLCTRVHFTVHLLATRETFCISHDHQ